MRLTVLSVLIALFAAVQDGSPQRREIAALNAAMVDAFKRDPASVAGFYADQAVLIGAGQRHDGRAAVDAYWKSAGHFTGWRLDVLATGGPVHAPWQYGRSVVIGRDGREMQTFFVGLLRRQPSGELKFEVDAYVRGSGSTGQAEAEQATSAWLRATETGDRAALERIFDAAYAVVSSRGVRSKAQEIAELVPPPGVGLPYFKWEHTSTHAFGDLAVTTGVLKWQLRADGPDTERHYSSVSIRRPDGWKIVAQQIAPVQPAAAQRNGNAALAEAVAGMVEQRYVFPEIGNRIAAHVREQIRRGAYDALTPAALADRLTLDLRAENGDRHLSVRYQAAFAGRGGGDTPIRQIPGGSQASLELARRRNYYVNRAERLDGNVGYLELRRFFGATDEARAAITSAMAFLAGTDAMIVDVRYAPGGDARSVDLLASYFFDRAVPTLATFSRMSNQTVQRTTLDSVPGRRRPDIPVYVLVSRDTGSAAEDFAFLMQQMRRATLIGDRTAGAGHTNAVMALGNGYSVSVSVGRTYNPATNQGWEGTGVIPEVHVPPPDALDAAHRLALTALLEKSSSAALKLELSWTRDALDARRTPVQVDAATLKKYAGKYGVRFIHFETGRLWYQRTEGAERLPLMAVSPTEFALGEGQRLQFVVTGSRVELRLLMTDGSHLAYDKEG